VGSTPVQSHSGLGIGARRSGGEAVGGGDAKALFCRVGGGAGRPGDRGKGGGRRWWQHWPFDLGSKMTGWGPRVGQRGRGGLAGLAKGRGPVAIGGGGPMGGERGVGRSGWKERRAVAGPNLEPGQNSKRNSFQILIDF
jgi:hypothetical protein